MASTSRDNIPVNSNGNPQQIKKCIFAQTYSKYPELCCLVAEETALTLQQSPTHKHSATYSAALTVGSSANAGVANTQLWPELASSSSAAMNNSSVTKAKSSWAAKDNTASKILTSAQTYTDYSSDGEDMLGLGTPHQNTLSDVLSQAMSQSQQRKTRKAETKKMKKNKKMQPLFTTGMNYNGN